MGVLDAWVRRAMTQPVTPPVAADDDAFLAAKGRGKVAFRLIRRQLEVALSGQRPREHTRIDPAWRRALWIHAEAPQIGDALMDLAPRSLLADRAIAVDLLAPASIAPLFRGDSLFGAVFAEPGDALGRAYDFAIVDSRSWKALQWKKAAWPTLPWVSIKGDYLPYDYHRALLATRRLAALLDVRLDAAAEAAHARQKLVLGHASTPAEPGHGVQVALALGGVRAERTYAHWPQVAARLRAAGVGRFVLLGSGNGRAMADAVRDRLPEGCWSDLVGRTDLHATRTAMAASSLVLAADGGLMHLALTTPTPVVALFDASIDPAWRLPCDFTGRALRAGTRDVNAIDAEEVVAAARSLLAPPDAGVRRAP